MAAGDISFRGKSPIELSNRIIAMQILREIGPDNINKLEDKKYDAFLIEEFLEDDSSRMIIDWEFALFKATEKQLTDLINNFERKPKEGIKVKPQSNLVLPNTPEIDNGERPALIL